MIDGRRHRVSLDKRFPDTIIRSVAEAVAARERLLPLLRADAPPVAAAAPRPEGVTLSEVATRYAAAQADNPDRSATYLGNLGACLALITSAPIADALAARPADARRPPGDRRHR